MPRAEKARRTRQRMTDAATRLFTERGWTGTTIEGIARAAGVGTQTVYFTFGNKRALLKEVVDTAIAGDAGPIATLDHSWARKVIEEPDPATQLRLQAAGARRILERATPLLEVVRSAAAAEPELAQLWQTNLNQRHTVQYHFAQALIGKPRTGLRDNHTAESAADIAMTVLGPETYTLLVTGRGWSPARWEQWAADSLIRQLLP